MQPYFERKGIVIYHADCRDVIPHLAAARIDLVMTDPPYAEQTHAGARTQSREHALVTDFASIAIDDLRSIYALMAPICTGWLVATMDWHHIGPLESIPPAGWRFIRFGVWVKSRSAPQFTGDRPAQGWEAIGIWHRAGKKLSWNGGGSRAVWTYAAVNANLHQTEKPLPLIRRLISLFSNQTDLVLDPFIGSGTTLKAAKDLGRRAIGIEIDERCCEIAARRVEQDTLLSADLYGDSVEDYEREQARAKASLRSRA